MYQKRHILMDIPNTEELYIYLRTLYNFARNYIDEGTKRARKSKSSRSVILRIAACTHRMCVFNSRVYSYHGTSYRIHRARESVFRTFTTRAHKYLSKIDYSPRK